MFKNKRYKGQKRKHSHDNRHLKCTEHYRKGREMGGRNLINNIEVMGNTEIKEKGKGMKKIHGDIGCSGQE